MVGVEENSIVAKFVGEYIVAMNRIRWLVEKKPIKDCRSNRN